MQIKKISIEGFKGKSIVLDLTGRDIVRAGNMAGKTSIAEAISFFSTGSVPGLKREDLIDYAPDGAFSVSFETDSGMRATRFFKVKKGGKTEMDLRFEPEGLEENLTERNERLHEEFGDAPLVTFDLTKFLTGDDSYRLKTCLELAPTQSGDDVDERMDAELKSVGDKLRSEADAESERDAILEVQEQLQGFRARLPKSLVDRCEALAKLVKDKWAKETRAEVNTKTKAVRALGSISRDGGISGVNVEALAEQVRQAQHQLDELQRSAGAAEERRRLIGELSTRIDNARAKKANVATELEEFAAAIKDQKAELVAAKKLMAEHEEAEASRVEEVEQEIKGTEREAQRLFSEISEAEDDIRALADEKGEAQEKIAAKLAVIDTKTTAIAALEASVDSCAVCQSKLTSEAKDSIMDALKADLAQERSELLDQREAREAIESDIRDASNVVDEAEQEAETCERLLAKLKRKLESKPYSGLHPEAIKEAIERNKLDLEKLQMRHDSIKADEFKWIQERGELANEMPEEMEQQAIAGAEQQRDQLQDRLEEAKRARQRFDDQERMRKELDAAERRLEALKRWGDALGLKGLGGKLLASQFDSIIAPASALVGRVLPECSFSVKWETPRGKPGMRIFLKRGEDEIAYSAMSGAERAIVGTALVLAFAGTEKPPAILCLECEVMDDDTEAMYLEALADLAGPTALLIMTHHGRNDLGIYSTREL